MRRMFAVAIAVVALGGTTMGQSPTDLVGTLLTGDSTGNLVSRATFHITGPEIRAVAVARELDAASLPLAPTWAQLSLAAGIRNVPDAPAGIPVDLTTGPITVFGGTIPPGANVPGWTPAATPTGVPIPPVGASALTADPAGLPMVGLKITPPSDGAVGTVDVTLTGIDGTTLKSVTSNIPDGGWWVLSLDAGIIGTPVPTDPGTPENPGGPTTTPTTSPPGVPEPGTMALAGMGLLGLAGWRVRRARR